MLPIFFAVFDPLKMNALGKRRNETWYVEPAVVVDVTARHLGGRGTKRWEFDVQIESQRGSARLRTNYFLTEGESVCVFASVRRDEEREVVDRHIIGKIAAMAAHGKECRRNSSP